MPPIEALVNFFVASILIVFIVILISIYGN